jgi:osmoprotectant transport system permease protein
MTGPIAGTLAWLLDPAHWQGPNGIPARMEEQIAISAAALLLAALFALPAGLAVGHTGRGATFAVNAANLGRALPSLAVIGMLVPLTVLLDPQLGFKVYPTLVAMVILAVPPILVNAYAGVSGVDREVVEASRGMGYRERQILAGVEIPLALPVIIGGVRLASIQVIGTATLGALFGFGGLGRYLVDGVDQNDDPQVFAGVVLVAGLAIATAGLLTLLQRRLLSPGLRMESKQGGAEFTPGR